MKISAKLLLFVVTVTMVFVPSVDGLKCYYCKTREPKSSDGELGRMGNESVQFMRSARQYHERPECKDFNEKTKKEERFQQDCTDITRDPVCFTLLKEPKESGCVSIRESRAYLPDKNKCNCIACTCDKDLCNKANDMNDSTKRVVIVALIGVLVRGFVRFQASIR
ncbi:hypothetical protein Fcan01_08791 [Folsomia candida]|uniref:Protein sleepless n=1 Tax=Folsomia candida TaxID=158441 RepID=A0A226EEW5_FOLCA|nr:hypothetical protein Fcan01_08791 [Folsomia candida]